MIQSNVIPKLPSGYEIGQSLRFNDNDSAYLSRVPSVAGSDNKWTLSFWVKRANLVSGASILGSTQDSLNFTFIRFDGDKFYTRFRISSTDYISTWTPLYRDTSSWYTFVYVFDELNSNSID